jgi:hypothetical protein
VQSPSRWPFTPSETCPNSSTHPPNRVMAAQLDLDDYGFVVHKQPGTSLTSVPGAHEVGAVILWLRGAVPTQPLLSKASIPPCP